MHSLRIKLRRILLAAAIVGFSCGTAIRSNEVAAPQLNEIDSRTRQRIALLDALLANSQWSDAAELLRSLSRQSEDLESRMVILPAANAKFQYAVPLHRHVQDRVADLPASQSQVRTEIRRRADSLAQELLRRGTDNRRISEIRRVIDGLFATSSADEALMRLGDFELQRGHASMARGYWSQISSEFGHFEGPFSSYPDSNIPRADVRARFVLVSILDHQFANAELELGVLRELHSNANGKLGGVQVNYVTALEEALQAGKAALAKRANLNEVADPTFEPRWRVKLESPAVTHSTLGTPKPIFQAMTLPVVVENMLVFSDGPTICARDIHSGKAVPWSDGANGEFFSSFANDGPPEAIFPFELSVRGSDVFGVIAEYAPTNHANQRSVVRFGMQEQGRLKLNSSLTNSNQGVSDFTPMLAGPILARDERQYVAMRDNSAMPETSVVCFNSTGQIWKTSICRAEQYSDHHRSHVALTYAEGHVIAVTNAGVIASLDATSGKVRWMTLYERASLDSPNLLARPWFRFRHRAKPLVHRGMILASPADFAGIVAIDLFSGRVLWETEMPAESFDAVDIVAATDQHVIANGRRLWWIVLKTGRLSTTIRQDNPLPRELQSGLRSHGRALLEKGFVYWPARDDRNVDQIFVFDAETGVMPRQPIQLTAANVEAGNLIADSGMLVIAGQNEIVAYPLQTDFGGGQFGKSKVE